MHIAEKLTARGRGSFAHTVQGVWATNPNRDLVFELESTNELSLYLDNYAQGWAQDAPESKCVYSTDYAVIRVCNFHAVAEVMFTQF